MKAKISAAGSSRLEDDVDMHDEDYQPDLEAMKGEIHESMDQTSKPNEQQENELRKGDGDGDRDEGEESDNREEDAEEEDGDQENEGGAPSSDGPPAPGGMDEASALAIFGDYRQFGSYMLSLSSRLKTMLTNIKVTADPTTRLLTLQELSELLSISTEDTLAGSFQVEAFVRELVRILGGKANSHDNDEDGDEDTGEQGEDAALAAALAMSSGETYQGDENPEAQVLACRCLANLMEALPGVAHTVVYHGAIPVLCSKLIEISYIDLAEQTLSVSPFLSLVRVKGLMLNINMYRPLRKFRKNFQAPSYAREAWQPFSITSTFFPSQCNELLFRQPPTVVETFPQSISL